MGFGNYDESPCFGCKKMVSQVWYRGDRNLYCYTCRDSAPPYVSPQQEAAAELKKLRNAVHTASFIFERIVQGHCTSPELNQAAWDFLKEWPGDYNKESDV